MFESLGSSEEHNIIMVGPDVNTFIKSINLLKSRQNFRITPKQSAPFLLLFKRWAWNRMFRYSKLAVRSDDWWYLGQNTCFLFHFTSQVQQQMFWVMATTVDYKEDSRLVLPTPSKERNRHRKSALHVQRSESAIGVRTFFWNHDEILPHYHHLTSFSSSSFDISHPLRQYLCWCFRCKICAPQTARAARALMQ